MFKQFSNLFKKNKKAETKAEHKVDAYTKDNLDVIFAEHFTQNGGFFNYEPDIKSALEVLQKLFNTIAPSKVLCFNKDLQSYLKLINQDFSETLNDETDAAFIDCESLIAGDGSIMISHDNIGNVKLPNLPKNVIVFSHTGQLVPTKSKGLELIRRNKTDNLPTNITSLNAKKSQDFLKPEFIKELYLMLIEKH